MRQLQRVWWLVLVALLVQLVARTSASLPDTEDVFCSRTQVQETSVRQQLLDTGQLMVSTHVLTSLRVGETVCISALLPEPPAVAPPAAATQQPPATGTAAVAELSEPNETTLMNVIHEQQETGDVHIPEERRAEQSATQSPPGVMERLEEDRDGAGVHLTVEGSRTWPPHVVVAETLAGASRRTERAARVPDMLSDGESRLSQLLLPSALEPPRLESAAVAGAGEDADPPRLRIQLTLESVQHQHAVTSAYTFSEPRMGVTCTCACASFHTCSGCGPLCVSKSSAAPAPDCDGSFLGSARTCCQLRVQPGRPFQAVRLGPASVLLRLRVAVTELGGGQQPTTERQTVEVSLGDEVRLDLNATRLRFSTQVHDSAPLPAGWYVLHQGHVYRPQQINELNEWNLAKLGWLKRRGDEHLMPSAARLQSAVHVTTVSCTEQQFQVRGDVLLDSTLPQLGPPLPDVSVLSRSDTQLRLRPAARGRPVWLGLHLQHLQRLRYLVHRARLADFDGQLRVDARAAVTAELRLWNGSGVQHGAVSVSYGADGPPPALYRFSVVAARRLQVRLPVALGAEQTTARLCLRPEGSLKPALCRELPVLRQPPETLQPDVTDGKHLVVNGESNPTNTVERFLRALNPATWLQGGGSWTTALGAVVDIVLFVIVVSILWKCFSCCRRSCCCCRPRGKADHV